MSLLYIRMRTGFCYQFKSILVLCSPLCTNCIHHFCLFRQPGTTKCNPVGIIIKVMMTSIGGWEPGHAAEKLATPNEWLPQLSDLLNLLHHAFELYAVLYFNNHFCVSVLGEIDSWNARLYPSSLEWTITQSYCCSLGTGVPYCPAGWSKFNCLRSTDSRTD